MALHEIPDVKAPSSQPPSTEQMNMTNTATSKSPSALPNTKVISATSDAPLDWHTLPPIYYQALANSTTASAAVGGPPSSLEGNASSAPPYATVNSAYGPLLLGPPPPAPLPQLPPPNGLFTQPLVAVVAVVAVVVAVTVFLNFN